ncbi:hypothetical protein ACLOJK_033773 [Asimina triloba]
MEKNSETEKIECAEPYTLASSLPRSLTGVPDLGDMTCEADSSSGPRIRPGHHDPFLRRTQTIAPTLQSISGSAPNPSETPISLPNLPPSLPTNLPLSLDKKKTRNPRKRNQINQTLDSDRRANAHPPAEAEEERKKAKAGRRRRAEVDPLGLGLPWVKIGAGRPFKKVEVPFLGFWKGGSSCSAIFFDSSTWDEVLVFEICTHLALCLSLATRALAASGSNRRCRFKAGPLPSSASGSVL